MPSADNVHTVSARKPQTQDLRISAERRLRVRTWPGTGRPLVLLHGLLDDSEGWAQLAGDTHRPCIAIDLPGFGGSDLPLRSRLSSYAEAICEGLEQLDARYCTLVGHSLGGGVATAVAERCDDVTALALVAPAGFGHIRIAELGAIPGIRHALQGLLPLALVNPLTVTAAYTTFVAHNRLPSRDLMGRVARRAFQSGPGVATAISAIAAAGRSGHGFANRPVDFDGPVAALWGEHDALVDPGHAEALQRSLPHAHVEVWQGMGHHPQRERPAELAGFIERHAARGRSTTPRRVIARAA
jgi:pyruvate dehydrogenase E2 component (dihydrolipoamide acetyltransferase)